MSECIESLLNRIIFILENQLKDLGAQLDKSNHIGKAALEDVMRLTKERDDLRAKLEAKNQEIYLLKKSEPIQVFWYKQQSDNLQAANVVLRGALERAQGIMQFHACRCPMNIPNNFSGSEEHLSEYRSVYKNIIPDALSTTPAEAGERVRGLVEALEEIMARCEHPKSEDDAHYENYYEAKEALAKYRGGAIE